MYKKILQKLEERFIYASELANILALAITTGQSVLLWGPAGHGKSEMVEAALAAVTGEENVSTQSCGEGLDEATLWGGIDLAALDRDKVMRFFPEQSFLAKDYAVLEELFDAPACVLLALKDTLTSKRLRKGAQVFAMKTKVIIACTNKNPDEISELGPAAHALIERFPLQLEVKWSDYKSANYLELFEKVAPQLSGPGLNGTARILADMMAKAGEGGQAISPRSAVHAIKAVKGAAALRGSALVEKIDLLALRFVDGLETLAASLQKEIDAAAERADAEAKVVAAEEEMARLIGALDEAKQKQSPIKLLQVARSLLAFVDKASALKVTDGLTDRRKRLRDSASEKASEAQKLALEYTKV